MITTGRVPLAVCCALIGMVAGAQTTATQQTHFDIKSQPLTSALNQWAKQTGVQIVYPGAKGTGRLAAHSVSGSFTPMGALEALLSGTEISYTVVNDRMVTLHPRTKATPASRPPSSPGDSRDENDERPQSSFLPIATEDERAAGGRRPGATTKSGRGESDNRAGMQDVIEEVAVVGTNIRGAAPIGNFVRILDRGEIEQRGYATTEQLVQSIQQNFRGGAAGATADRNFSAGSLSGYNTSYGSGVNIRGLGANATLVLVNGHRVASSGSGFFTDISTIPVSAIDRIEVLTDGASAIYGSDAIGGVLNIVLKDRSDAVEASARAGATSRDGYSTSGATLQIGGEWDRWGAGSATIGTDVSKQTTLDASERAFTAGAGARNSVVPAVDQIAVTAAARQDIGERLNLHGDAQYAKSDRTAFYSPAATPPTYRYGPSVERWSSSLGAALDLTDTIAVQYDLSAGQEISDLKIHSLTPAAPAAFFSHLTTDSEFVAHTAALSGAMFTLPGGAARFAVGASYRSEEYQGKQYEGEDRSTVIDRSTVDRNVTAGYAEVNLPIFGAANSIPGFSALTLSAAVRRDHYSDFGDTTNPKYGVSWYPTPSLELRGAYSTSFRAPAAGTELINSERGITVVVIQAMPYGTVSVPVALLLGGQAGLRPETAESMTFGLTFKPQFAPGLELSLNYYEIDYSDQLAAPPFSQNALNDPALASVVTQYPDSAPVAALLNAASANQALILDVTDGEFGADPVPQTVFIYDSRTANLSATKTAGFDLAGAYSWSVRADTFEVGLDATYIDKFVTSIAAGAPQVQRVDSVGYPARFRLRGQTSWSRGGLSLSLAGNYVGGYPETSAAVARDVGSYTTFDVVGRYDFSGTSVPLLNKFVASLAATNVLDQSPPYVVTNASESGLSAFHFDPANADAVGRFLMLTLTKRL